MCVEHERVSERENVKEHSLRKKSKSFHDFLTIYSSSVPALFALLFLLFFSSFFLKKKISFYKQKLWKKRVWRQAGSSSNSSEKYKAYARERERNFLNEKKMYIKCVSSSFVPSSSFISFLRAEWVSFQISLNLNL